ncbi:MAG: GEVED domain-containing protein, partial [Candidatus Promineifilaceae bacterium]|nr:GEVED domain-containing protein [Candidatus Promineifilaceae bacterium]
GPTLYAALVVGRAKNDTVCAPQNADEDPYMQSADWFLGSGRDCKRGTDSEFFEFELRCPLAGQEAQFKWQQGFAEYYLESEGVWRWRSWLPPGLPEDNLTGPPPSYEAASSWVWNANNYVDRVLDPEDNPPWPLYYEGTADPSTRTDWKSPFDDQEDVTKLEGGGYPSTGQITFNDFYEWEWPQVYEWKADLAQACGGEQVYVLSGSSHHSPPKEGPEDESFCEGTFEECAEAIKDMGDLPDTYSTTVSAGGPEHLYIFSDTVQLGPTWDPESDGQPSGSAIGDDQFDNSDDEDGVRRGPQNWTNGAVVDIIIDVQGEGDVQEADVGLWLDWNGDGAFDGSPSSNEFYPYDNLPVGISTTVQIVVPDSTVYTVGNAIAARARIVDDESLRLPDGNIDPDDFAGPLDSGEVEDYIWQFTPTAITMGDVSAESSAGPVMALLVGLLLLSAATVLALRRSRAVKNS